MPGLGNLSRDIQGREITMMVRVASVRVSGGGVGDAGLVLVLCLLRATDG